MNNKSFIDTTILIPAVDETHSLAQTVDVIFSLCNSSDINKIIIILSETKSTPDCKKTANELCEKYKSKVEILYQKLPFSGGAVRTGFDAAQGSHVIIMSADLETDPSVVPIFIEKAKETPEKIITASRWKHGGGFNGYNRFKLYCNFVFQKILAIMFFSKLTDMTFGYRIIPTYLIKTINWQETKHPLFLETSIVPLRLGVNFVEVPVHWASRTEGVSQNSFWANFRYFKTAFRVRFCRKSKLLKS